MIHTTDHKYIKFGSLIVTFTTIFNRFTLIMNYLALKFKYCYFKCSYLIKVKLFVKKKLEFGSISMIR
jgi:hypothetical protein